MTHADDAIPAPPRRRGPRPLPVALAFAGFGALEIGFVFLVAGDTYTRVTFGGLLAIAQVVGGIAFYRIVSRPPRRRPATPRRP